MKIERKQDDPILEKGDIWYQPRQQMLIIGSEFSLSFEVVGSSLYFMYNWKEGKESYTKHSIVYRWEKERDED